MNEPAVLITGTNTILYCAQWTETVDFYRNKIGLRASFENDWFVEFDLGNGAHVSIANADRATIEPLDGVGITLSWQVADLPKACGQLEAVGVALSPLTPRWGATTVFLHDPDGNRIELWSKG